MNKLITWEPGDGTRYELAVCELPTDSRMCGGNLLLAPLYSPRCSRPWVFSHHDLGAGYMAEKFGATDAGASYDIYIYRAMLFAAFGEPEGHVRRALCLDHNPEEWAQPRFENFNVSTIEVHG